MKLSSIRSRLATSTALARIRGALADTVTHIVVHYSATPRGQHVTVAEIDGWHRARGFAKIGYHKVVYLDGTVHNGRAESEIGAHVGGQNRGKIGICWIGGTEPGKPDVGVDTRTPAQTRALIRLIRDLLKRYPGARVVGHRDLAATQCPGFDVIPWWASVNGVHADDVVPPVDHSNDPVRTPDVAEDPRPPRDLSQNAGCLAILSNLKAALQAPKEQ